MEFPAERPVARRPDPGAADLDTQVDLGWQEPPPEPPPPPPPAEPPPDPEPPTEPAQEMANVMMLDTALVDSGVVKTPDDATAVTKLAKLDAATVETVARWIKRGRPSNPK
jgi:hypothetical protein